MTEMIFFNQLGPGTKDKNIAMDKKPRYESRKMVLDQVQKI